MSAVLSRPKRPSLPLLPPELWLNIFAFATWAPRGVEAYLSKKSHSRGYWWGIRHPDLKSAFVTRRFLVRVCRQWRSLATPLLYEHIIIGRAKFASSLRHTLAASEREAESTENYRSLGSWTKRLDVAVRDGDDKHAGSLDMKDLCSIIRCLPNLTAVVFSLPFGFFAPAILPESILDALVETCSTTLHDMLWTTTSLLPDREQWCSFLTKMPGLRRLGCPYTYTSPHHMLQAVTLPSISGLTITPSSVEVSAAFDDTNHFPSLQELVYSRWGVMGPSLLGALLRVSGHTITRVVLSVDDSHALLSELIVLKRFCPNLIRLDIAFRRWRDMSSICDIPPVSILGLHCSQLRAKSREYQRLFDILHAVRPLTLKVIRFLDHRIVENLRGHHPNAYKVGISVLNISGCRVEDHEGVSLLTT